MKTFNDCFYLSENKNGFMKVFDSVDNEKLADLIGTYTSDDIVKYDIYLKSRIGFLTVSPLLSDIFKYADFSSLLEKQQETIKMFLMLRYNDLLKVKNILISDISIHNGYTKSEDISVTRDDTERISSFNSGSLEDNTRTDFSSDTDKNIVRRDTNTQKTLNNIAMLTDFYKQSMFDKIIEYIKDMFTLQVVD